MMRVAVAVVLAALTPAAVMAQARPQQPSSAARPKVEDPRPVANQVLTRLAGEGLAERVVESQRRAMIGALERAGQTPAEAAVIFDSYFVQDYRKRTPELVAALQDVLIAEFTVPELRSLVDNKDSEPRRSAQPKLAAIPGRLAEAEKGWAVRVGGEALEKNKDELAKLGLIIGGVR